MNEIMIVKKKKYFPMFDYCRFAGCLLIFLYHYDGLSIKWRKTPCDAISVENR